MKKIFLLIFLLILTTGCSVEYNLDLTNSDIVYENMKVIEDDPQDNYFNYLNNYHENIEAFYNEEDSDTYTRNPDLEYYSINNQSTENTAILDFNYAFSNDELINSNIIKSCFANVSFINTNKVININSENFLCFKKYISLDTVTINIKTNKKITEHNADVVKDNTYSWVINKDNLESKSIHLTSLNSKPEENPSLENNQSKIFVSLIIIGLFIVTIIILFLYKNHKYNSN